MAKSDVYMVYTRGWDGKPCYIRVRAIAEGVHQARIYAHRGNTPLMIVEGTGRILTSQETIQQLLVEIPPVTAAEIMEVGHDID